MNSIETSWLQHCSPFRTIIPHKGHNHLHSGQHGLMGQLQKTRAGYLTGKRSGGQEESLEDILKTLIITSGDFKCGIFVIFSTIDTNHLSSQFPAEPELPAKIGVLGLVLTNGCHRLKRVHIEWGHIILLSPCLEHGQ